jgi:hypothetical protein
MKRIGWMAMTLDRNWLEERVEPLARVLAAERMGLTKDTLGENLPHDLWSQKISEARRFLGLEELDKLKDMI